jgi:hypothetical protein
MGRHSHIIYALMHFYQNATGRYDIVLDLAFKIDLSKVQENNLVEKFVTIKVNMNMKIICYGAGMVPH